MTLQLNAHLNRFRSMKRSNLAISWNAWDISTALFPVLHVFWQKTWCPRWKTPLEYPWKCHFWGSKFQMSLDASAFKNLCLWCEFQSSLLFITSLLLKNFLTALYDLGTVVLTVWIHYTYPVRQRNFIFILWNKPAFVTTARATSNAEMKLSVPHTSCYNKKC